MKTFKEWSDPLKHNDGKDQEDIFWIGIDPHIKPPKPREKWHRGHPHPTSNVNLPLWLTRSEPDAGFYGPVTQYEIDGGARFGSYKDLVRAVRETDAKRSEIKAASGWDGSNDNDFIYIPKVKERLSKDFDGILLSDVMTNYEIDALVVLNKKIAKVS
jgi:hypothetical protein